jgi:hypothetical protein
MALDQSALLEVLGALKGADVEDRIRAGATTIYQALIVAELTAVIGAGPHERTEARTGQRNGYRPKTITTTAGDLEFAGVLRWDQPYRAIAAPGPEASGFNQSPRISHTGQHRRRRTGDEFPSNPV